MNHDGDDDDDSDSDDGDGDVCKNCNEERKIGYQTRFGRID